ncbi:MAG: hypothetical protein ACI4F4_11115 [Lachnospiraceae bacterium]
MIKESEYSVNEVSKDAVISCILGVISIIAMVLAVVASYKYDGNGPAVVGLLGIAGLIFSLCGISFGFAAWKSADGGILMKRIALIGNMIPFITAIIFYIMGWVS